MQRSKEDSLSPSRKPRESGFSGSKPIRIQRKRSGGWRMPEGVVYVGRPTKWGNPWTIEKYWEAGYSGSADVAAKHCVEAFRAWLEGRKHWAHGTLKPVPDLTALRGKALACWCKEGSPCHADVLLDLANHCDPETPHSPVEQSAGDRLS